MGGEGKGAERTEAEAQPSEAGASGSEWAWENRWAQQITADTEDVSVRGDQDVT